MFLGEILLNKFYNYNLTHFLISVLDINHLIIDNGIEIAFAGYSNVGKSSVLNTLTNQKKLAKTSKSPGCTKLINLFEVEPGIRLVDLPGYGYASVPKKRKYTWELAIKEYLQKRNNLKGLVVLMDIRHPMKNFDQKIIHWAVNMNMPILILLNKSDKLSENICKIQLNKVRKVALSFMGNVQVQIFSSLKKQGVNELRQQLNTLFALIPPVYI